MSMVLVLDYSSSIGTDFDKLKQSAVKFIENIYAKSPNGNVKIGIVLFNTMDNTDKMIYPIKGLDGNTKSEMIRFIKSPDIKKNTALYYAMEKGVNMLEDYSKNISSDKYDGSYLITFTDGIDNQSMDAKLGAPTDGKADPYFQHIKNIINNKKIKGKKIESHIIAVHGDDVGDNLLFKSILEDLSNNFILAENFDEVNATFAKIANDLINKWQDLDCYVPPRFKGKVRWTLDEDGVYEKPVVPVKNIKTTKNYFKSTLYLGYIGFASSLTYGHRFKNPKKSFGINTMLGVIDDTYGDYYYFIPSVFFQYSYILNKSNNYSFELYSNLGTYFAPIEFDYGIITHPIGINFGFHKIGFEFNMLFMQGIFITSVGIESGFYIKF